MNCSGHNKNLKNIFNFGTEPRVGPPSNEPQGAGSRGSGMAETPPSLAAAAPPLVSGLGAPT